MVDIDYITFINAIVDAIPFDVFLWIKFAMIVMVIFFVVLIVKNLIQIGTSSRIRKILKVALKINKKIDSIVVSSVVTPEEVQTDEYNYQ